MPKRGRIILELTYGLNTEIGYGSSVEDAEKDPEKMLAIDVRSLYQHGVAEFISCDEIDIKVVASYVVD